MSSSLEYAAAKVEFTRDIYVERGQNTLPPTKREAIDNLCNIYLLKFTGIDFAIHYYVFYILSANLVHLWYKVWIHWENNIL